MRIAPLTGIAFFVDSPNCAKDVPKQHYYSIGTEAEGQYPLAMGSLLV